MRAIWSLSLAVALAGIAGADEVQRTILRLQDRLNNFAVNSVLGSVDYEFVYATSNPKEEEGIVFLEEVNIPTAVAVDSTGKGDTSIEATVAVVSRTGGDRLTTDLKEADVNALKSRLHPLIESPEEPLYLGVRAVGEDGRYPGENLSLNESELPAMERRHLRWDYLEMMYHWPPGSILFLESGKVAVQGEEVEVPVRWSFKRPSVVDEEKLDLITSGETNLSLRKVGAEWKVSHVERLIGALHTGVVKEQK